MHGEKCPCVYMSSKQALMILKCTVLKKVKACASSYGSTRSYM